MHAEGWQYVPLELLQFHDIASAISVAITTLLLHAPVKRKTAALDLLQRGLASINALLEGGTEFHADIGH